MATVAAARPSCKGGTQSRADRSSGVQEAESDRAELAALVRERSFSRRRVTLSSGRESDMYFNMKATMMHPRGAELAARALLRLARDVHADYVSGLEMGAVPVIGSMAAIGSAEGNAIRTTFVRKRAKEHGTKDRIEGLAPGEGLEGRTVLVVDDVATSGGSILQAVDEIRRVGGIVCHAACLVDREEGGVQLLSDHGVRLHHVLTAAEIADGT